VLRGKAIVGMPEMVADRLRGLREELGLAGILAEMNCRGLIPQERMMPLAATELQLICEKAVTASSIFAVCIGLSAEGGLGRPYSYPR
jgi:hypothetical protein